MGKCFGRRYSLFAIQILRNPSVDIEMRDPKGCTAIMHACTMGYDAETEGVEWDLLEDAVEEMRKVASVNPSP